MRLLMLTVCFLFAFSGHAQKATPAEELLEAAQEKAAKNGKKVFVIYHASCCGWCKRMDATMQSEALQPLFNEHYEIVHLSVLEQGKNKKLENKGANEFFEQHGGSNQGLPYWVILNKEGEVLATSKMPDDNKPEGQNTGCPVEEKEVQHLVRVIHNTSSIDLEGLKTIFESFSAIGK
jgi:thioredoxin-related protein